jgi:GTPase
MAQQATENFRAGFAAIIGEPNVGKSTLMNGLLQQKISIVTPKPQTTRNRVLGILSSDEYQVIFLDTPGIIAPRYALHEAMMRSAATAVADADIVLFMIDASHARTAADAANIDAFKTLSGISRPVFLLINKVDCVVKTEILGLIDSYSRAFSFKEIFPISALKLDGTRDLLKALVEHLPVHPPYYPLDIVSEQNQRFFVGEIVREKIFMKCQEEIPYSTTVDIIEFKEREGGKWFISGDIYVEKDSQKGILIGKKGSMLKDIGQLSRRDIEKFLEHPVFLELHVKVRENWREDENWLRRLGYTP